MSESPGEFNHDNSRVPPRDLESGSPREEEEETSNQHFLQSSPVVPLYPAVGELVLEGPGHVSTG